MRINIRIDNMNAAEKLSQICKDFDSEITLRGKDKFCVDPKSTLGIFAMMYTARDSMVLDTGDMEDRQIPELVSRLNGYIKN